MARLSAALAPVSLLDATAADLLAWRASLKVGDETVVNYVSHVRAFYGWLAGRWRGGRDMSEPVVMIDGVRYVPVSQAHIAVPAIEDAVVSQWAGDNWRSEYPDAPEYLRVTVSDDTEGDTVAEFCARLLAAVAQTQDQVAHGQ